MKVSEALLGYTISQKIIISQTTLNLYLHWLKLFEADNDDPEVELITSSMLKEWIAYMRVDYVPKRTNNDTSPLAGSSIQTLINAIRSFSKWAEEELGIPRQDLSIKIPKYSYPQTQPFSPDEIRALVQACKFMKPSKPNKKKSFVMHRNSAKRDVAIILLLLDTGLRVSEACRLNIEDVNLETGDINLNAYGTGRKTKARTVFLGNNAKKAMWQYLQKRKHYFDDQPLFITRNGRRMERTGLRHMTVRLGERSGVAKVTPHRFRHTFAIEYLRNGGDIYTLQRMLGHSDLRMVLNYLAIADADTKEAHRRASPGDRILF